MTTASCLSAPVPLHRPWLRRVAADLWAALQPAHRKAGLSERDYRTLAHLSESTLRDIGAPDWVHEHDRGLPLWVLERARW